MILITGAAGKTGRAVIRALTKGAETIRGLVRRAEQAPSLEALGVEEVRVVDLLDRDKMAAAVQGIRAIYHLAPNVSPDEMEMGKVIIAAATSNAVEHFVFHSVLHPQIEAMPHHWQKARVEELLFASGLPFTILQPTAYMQNILAQWDHIIGKGKFPVPYPAATRLCLVDLEDVAQAAATVLSEPGHIGAIIELVGTPPMSQSEIAEVLAGQLGISVTADHLPVEVWERGVRASGLGDYQVRTLIEMFHYYENHGLVGNSNALRCLLQRQPTSFPEFVRRIAGKGENDHRTG
jgi:uncharacterized protein YbjT (DUF2867 family)